MGVCVYTHVHICISIYTLQAAYCFCDVGHVHTCMYTSMYIHICVCMKSI